MAADVLSNVIDRGAAASKPTSPLAEGYLYFETDTGRLVRYSGSAWETVSRRGLLWVFDTTTTDSDPGAGKMRFDNSTPASVTNIYIDDVPASADADLSTAYADMANAHVLIQQVDDETKYLLGKVSAVTDGTGYYKLTITVGNSGTLIDNNALVEMQIIGGGGGGGASLNWQDDLAKVNVVSYVHSHDGTLTGYMGSSGGGTAFSGTSAVDGATGAGGFTDAIVGCSCYFDTSPAAGGTRGWFVGDKDIPFAVGHFFRVYARFSTPNDQHLRVAWCDTNMNDSLAIFSDVAGFVKRATDTNWQAVTNEGTLSNTWTFTDTGVAWSDDWVCFECYVYFDTGTPTVKFYIDGSLVATHLTNLPDFAPATIITALRVESYFLTTGNTGLYDQVFFTRSVYWVVEDQGSLRSLGYATLPSN